MKMYLLLRKGAFAEVERLGREILEPIKLALEAEAEIVNYEIACKRTKGKVHSGRLENLLQYTGSFGTQAAVYALLGKKSDMISAIKNEINKIKTFRFEARRWPVFA